MRGVSGSRGGRAIRIPTLTALIAGLIVAFAAAETKPAAKATMYVGTYTGGTSASKGIYTLELDLSTGALATAGAPVESVSPSFLALHPNGRFLYAVNETGDSRADEGGVSA